MTQIIVLVVKSHIRAVRWSSGGQKARRDKTAFVTGTALHVISGSSAFYQLLRKRQSLHFSSVFLIFFTHLFPHIDTFSWGHPRLQSAEGETCTGCSCSAGLCLVSLMLSKADHTVPSTTPAATHSLYIYHPVCLCTATCSFLAQNCWHVLAFTVETALCHSRCSLQSNEVNLDE